MGQLSHSTLALMIFLILTGCTGKRTSNHQNNHLERQEGNKTFHNFLDELAGEYEFKIYTQQAAFKKIHMVDPDYISKNKLRLKNAINIYIEHPMTGISAYGEFATFYSRGISISEPVVRKGGETRLVGCFPVLLAPVQVRLANTSFPRNVCRIQLPTIRSDALQRVESNFELFDAVQAELFNESL